MVQGIKYTNSSLGFIPANFPPNQALGNSGTKAASGSWTVRGPGNPPLPGKDYLTPTTEWARNFFPQSNKETTQAPSPTPMTTSPTQGVKGPVPENPPFPGQANPAPTPTPTWIGNRYSQTETNAGPIVAPQPYSCHKGVESIDLATGTRTCDLNSDDGAFTLLPSSNVEPDSTPPETTQTPSPTLSPSPNADGRFKIQTKQPRTGVVEERVKQRTQADVCDASFDPASLNNLSREEATKTLDQKGYTKEAREQTLKELFPEQSKTDENAGGYSGGNPDPTKIVEPMSLFSGIKLGVGAGAMAYCGYKTYEAVRKYFAPEWNRKRDTHSQEKRQQIGWDALKWGAGTIASAAFSFYTFQNS